MDAGLHRIALGFPSGDLGGDLLRAVEPPIQALPVHDADLRFRHVEPTAMLGRVMKLDPVQQLPSLGGTESLVQAGPVVRIQVVLHQPNLDRPRVMHLGQLSNAGGIVPSGAMRRHANMTPAPQRLTHHQLMGHALALVFIIDSRRRAGSGSLGGSHLPEQLLERLIKADHRIVGVIRPQIGLDHILHAPDKVGVGRRWDAPGRHDRRLDVVFFYGGKLGSGVV